MFISEVYDGRLDGSSIQSSRSVRVLLAEGIWKLRNLTPPNWKVVLFLSVNNNKNAFTVVAIFGNDTLVGHKQDL